VCLFHNVLPFNGDVLDFPPNPKAARSKHFALRFAMVTGEPSNGNQNV
jgi:hypothetical protein